jgi:hypothetical protein
MTTRTLASPAVFLILLACSREVKIPPRVYDAAFARTTSLATADGTNLSGLQRSLYASSKTDRFYCVDFVTKTTLQDLVFVTVYDETTETFRPVEGGHLVNGLNLAINEEVLKPRKTSLLLAVQQVPQVKDSKP